MANQDDVRRPPPGQEPRNLLLSTDLLENIPEGFLALDHDWRVIYINALGKRILGRPRADLVGRVIWEAFPETVASPFEQTWRRAMEQRTTGQVEAYYAPLDAWFEEHAYPAPEGIWIFFQNITERKRQQAALEETTTRLRRTVLELEASRQAAERTRLEVADGARWLAFLAEVERILASSLEYRTVLDSLVHAAVPAMADMCGVAEAGSDGKIHTVAIALGDRAREDEMLRRLGQHPTEPDQPEGIARVVRTGVPMFNPEITDEVLRRTTRDEAQFQAARALGLRSGMIIPLRSRRQIMGAIWFATTTSSGRRYDETDFDRARDLIGRAALAVDNALLYQDIERAERRSRFLSEAGEVFASSTPDYETTLQNVAQLAVPLLADYCIIDLTEDSMLRPVATAHRDPAADRLLAGARSTPPTPARGVLQEVLRTGEAKLIPEVTPAVYDALSYSPQHLELLRTMGAERYLLVPLTARGRTLGVLTLASTDPNRHYDAENRELAEELARRAALAVDNARLYQESLAANRAKSDFLAVVSHELRTPLNAIIGYTDLLRTEIAGPLTPEQASQLARVDSSAHHLLQLIEEVLTYSRMEAGREELQLRMSDMGELLRALSAPAALQAERKGLAFHLDLPDTPLRIRTDPTKVRQIVANLLSNAVKFTERGEVTLSARLDDDSLLVRVKDTGLGIAPEHFEKIFEPFWQAEPATTRRAGGTGLGLPVSRRLARLLGGELTVESVGRHGSTFTLRLPRSAPHSGAPSVAP